jgi:hypothetical protein
VRSLVSEDSTIEMQTGMYEVDALGTGSREPQRLL